jgi:hypothetical protein
LRVFLHDKWLTMPVHADYIRPSGRATAWRDGASAKPLTVHTVTEHPAMLFLALALRTVRVAATVERVFVSPSPCRD